MDELKNYVVVVSWWGQKHLPNSHDGEGMNTDAVMVVNISADELRSNYKDSLFHAAELSGTQIAFHLEPYEGRSAKSVKVRNGCTLFLVLIRLGRLTIFSGNVWVFSIVLSRSSTSKPSCCVYIRQLSHTISWLGANIWGRIIRNDSWYCIRLCCIFVIAGQRIKEANPRWPLWRRLHVFWCRGKLSRTDSWICSLPRALHQLLKQAIGLHMFHGRTNTTCWFPSALRLDTMILAFARGIRRFLVLLQPTSIRVFSSARTFIRAKMDPTTRNDGSQQLKQVLTTSLSPVTTNGWKVCDKLRLHDRETWSSRHPNWSSNPEDNSHFCFLRWLSWLRVCWLRKRWAWGVSANDAYVCFGVWKFKERSMVVDSSERNRKDRN